MRTEAFLKSAENERKITEERDAEFLDLLLGAVLLALQEGGMLNETQYRYAEEKRKIRRGKTP